MSVNANNLGLSIEQAIYSYDSVTDLKDLSDLLKFEIGVKCLELGQQNL